MPGTPVILALPAEILLKIFKDPELRDDDDANLRLVCKDFLPYATQALTDECFKDGLSLNPSPDDFARLAALCSSQLRPYLKSVYFRDYPAFRITQNNENVCPEYSAIQKIKFETHLWSLDATRILKKLLQQTNHLEIFMFNPRLVREGNSWHTKYDRSLPPLRTSGDRSAERGKVNAVLASIKSDCLSEMILADTVLSYKPLISLLEKHRGTIRKLSLRDCRLISGGWVDLLQWISYNLPSLEHLDLQYLQELTWRRAFSMYDYSDMMWETPVTTTGKKNIDTYIATLRNEDVSDRR
jgi:hypothetical protein